MIHAVGKDYVRESDMPDMDWQQEQFYRHARSQGATKPVPGWVAVLGFAAAFGAILWTMLEVGFRMKGW